MDVQPRHTDCISIYFHVNKRKRKGFAFTVTVYRGMDVEAAVNICHYHLPVTDFPSALKGIQSTEIHFAASVNLSG